MGVLSVNPFTVIPGFYNPISTEFDGSNDYVNYGVASGLISTTEWSLSMWVKLLSYPTTTGARIWSDASGYFYLECTSSGTGNFRYVGNGTTNTITLSLNTWTQIIYRRKVSANSTSLIKNAVIPANTGCSAIANISNNFYMGGPNVGGYQVNMRVHLWEVWDKYLTDAECGELYNGGVPINPASTSMAANLVHAYRSGNGDTHPTITDRKGSVNGTMNNMSSANFVTDQP